MKIILRTATMIAAAFLAGASLAADLPSRKAAPAFVTPAPIIDWTGIYVGVQAGYGFGVKAIPLSYYQNGWQANPLSIKDPLLPKFTPYEFGSGASAFVNTSGFFAGGVIGYNQQFGKFVVGVDADFNPRIAGHGQTATFALPTLGVYPSIATVGETWNWGSTIDGRAGYLVTPSLLLYVRGGLALVQTPGHITTANLALLSSGYGTSGAVYSGWNVGGGVEYKLTPSISTKVQYTHIDVGSHTMSLSGLAWDAAGQQETQLYIGRIHPREDVVTVGVNFQLPNLLGNVPSLTK
jgi:outer membrane immunogenic protein